VSAPLRLAVAQASAVSGDVAGNAACIGNLVELAASAGARVVVTPELFLQGYDLQALAGNEGLDLIDADDVRLDALREACRRTSTVAVISASMRTDRGRTIAIVVVAGDGRAVHAYDKQHLPGDEAEIFGAGEHGALIVVDGWSLGLGVCYDGCFPEHARACAQAGAGGYLVPAAYVVGAEHRRDLYYPARALDNGMYVAMAGLVGRCGEGDFGGGSAVYDPQGRRVAGVDDGVEDIAFADLDAAVVADTRDRHAMGRDRRSDLGPVTPLDVA
jgi:predicted amidohydrolase